MARIRTIKPEFWEDEKIASLPVPCRLFFIGTWTHADDYGVFRGSPAILKSKIFPYDDNLRVSEVSKWLDALVEARMLIPISYKSESYYVIRTFRSHQKFDARYPNYLIPKEVLEDLIQKRCDNDGDTTGSLRVPDASPTGTRCVPDESPTCPQRKPAVSPPREGEGVEGKGEGKKESADADEKEGEPDGSTLSPDYLKFQGWLKRKAPYCSNIKNFSHQITEEEFYKLKEKYSGTELADVIEQIENRKDLRKRYTNLYRTVLNWIKK